MPNEHPIDTRRRVGIRTWVALAIAAVVLTFFTFCCVGVIRTQMRIGATAQAYSNSKDIGAAMARFAAEYGHYPDGRSDWMSAFPNPGFDCQGFSSNAHFRQLIASGLIHNEKAFYAKIPGSRKPDENKNGRECLAPGEAGFAYITGVHDVSLRPDGNPRRPLLVSAACKHPFDGTFDPAPFDRHAIIFRTDQSASSDNLRHDRQLPIDRLGHALLETGPDTVWGADETPQIHLPERLW